jgi:hypothetical protein
MDRRLVLTWCTYIASLGCVGCSRARAQDFPTSAPPPERPRPRGRDRESPGASTRSGGGFRGVEGCGLTPGVGDGVRLLRRSGVREVDQHIGVESTTLAQAFGLDPRFAFFDDEGSPNALAFPGSGPGDPGTVLLGTELIRNERESNPRFWETAIIGILAHEWGHAFQFANTFRQPRYIQETHADFMAGWYLGAKASAGSQLNIDAFARSLYDKGSNSGFFNIDDYGSPNQRALSMAEGFRAGLVDTVQWRRPRPLEAAQFGIGVVLRIAGVQ